MKQIEIHSVEDTIQLATKIASFVTPGTLITLKGDLGAGKTTFTKALGKALGVKKTINSPTFTILKIYQGTIPLYHMDTYRLEGITQDLGFDEYFEGDGVCIVEWPDYIKDQLPSDRLEICMYRMEDEAEDKRMFELRAFGKPYETILEAL